MLRRVAMLVSALAALVIMGAAADGGRGVNDAAIMAEGYPATLSEFRLFADTARRTPAPRVTAYTLNTPLFSDYAEKQRYLYVPAGKTAAYDPEKILDLPVGSALVKTFGYQQGGAFKPLETRLLLHRASGWVAIPYVWNATGTDAVLKRAGTRIPVTFTDSSGRSRSISYAVPNQNQCKDCHGLAGAITPIGPKARNLNDGAQLQALVAAGLLDRAPADAPRLARWDDEAAPLADRATAYLETNCAHCHNRDGAASNSGLFFGWKEPDPNTRGILKRPVAAGRGSGNDDFDIDPGHPEKSILLYRLASTDPGIAMPELGRATAHDEGIALLTRWIAGMEPDGPAPR
ncbi:MAG: hypothetical protein JWN66_2953 [Sphingomonas bacterium]|uniref:SO2930 family diheme c-type cytochrome n=1 Tax=Sphingomonas bacterium TaxID=1895847 RepID=UPI00261987F1|nr:SO2930 family diheme c-type cytochrome [Sphingomonas bacterium]MDB5705837.1 hypothetical protein [Sphingomonas bacterium]